jgi:F-type H+-transporting ATPase subunit b|tara:strand:+ start:11566 stop:12105 length:540 start_codon:yes stop_codon:yes gene_type:complete
MISQSLILLSAGGLFDFGATLPALILQFVLLMVVLNLVLYTPLLNAINTRNNYILENLSQSSDYLAQADELTAKYETELKTRRQSAQSEIKQVQKDLKVIIEADFTVVNQLTSSYVSDITKKIIARNAQLFQVMFGENTDFKELGSYNLSSQLFYNLWFPYYSREKRQTVKKKRGAVSI